MYIIIVGGGKIGFFLAKRLFKDNHAVVVVEKDAETADVIAREFKGTVICGDGCEPSVLEQAGIARADVVAAVTGVDEDNFIICQIAKDQFRVNRTVGRVNDPDNERAFNELGIDVPIGVTMILAKIIEEEVSFSDFVDLLSFKRGKLALIRVDLPESSPVINKKVQDLQLPPSSVLVSVVRGDDVIVPKGDTVLKPLDDVVALTLVENKQQLLSFLIGKM
ncbi:MAG TPA: TrkA family potassium uptake protein [Candidatus Omnitrophota bacterium]|nr:TrkA family potassium uptake protein [Candidatus Omnitrophota bacterium]HPD84575.1 TrkA family potassium uptake protein [Candidatus Omnitrophota bacterium]HRZ03433.1 TrkA family potassium uptake protein [Candidatus Omnitrophota bacterium]